MIWQQATAGTRWVPALLVLAAGLVAGGCASGSKPASVSGHVTYKGKPVTSGVVVLIDKDGKASDPGPVQPDGTYSIAHAPVGTLKVSFDNPPPSRSATPARNNPEAQEEAQEAARYVPTPAKYKDPNTSGLTVDIQRGRNRNVDLDLQGPATAPPSRGAGTLD